MLGDAFDYVENGKISEKQNIVFVDIFVADDLPLENIFSKAFMDGLSKCTCENAVVMFNLLLTDKERVLKFALGAQDDFDRKAIIASEGKTTLVFAKSENKEKLSEFLTELEKIGITTVIK